MLRFGRTLWNVLRHPVWRGLLVVGFLGWLFDRAIFTLTEAAWFVSMGQSRSLTQHLWLQSELFALFLLASLSLSVAVMRVVARPDSNFMGETDFDSVPLPRALRELELTSWRRRAPRLGWLLLMVAALLGARELARHASAFERLASEHPLGFTLFQFDVSPWIFHLPTLAATLNAWWHFSLAAFVVLSVGGALRSLPQLAARHPQIPTRWGRALGLLGIHLLSLRTLGYALAALNVGAGGLTFDELFINLPLWILGIFLCLLAIAVLARKLNWKTRRRSLVATSLAALVLPTALSLLLWPVRVALRGLEPPFLTQIRRDATTAAWELRPPPIAASPRQLPLRDNWPVWDEETLLLAANHTYEREHLSDGTLGAAIKWQNATFFQQNGFWRALVVGEPALLGNDTQSHEATPGNSARVMVLDPIHPVEGLPRLEPSASPTAFYGLPGRPLLATEHYDTRMGVPFENWGWKLAWAWRLRDVSLLFEGGSAQKLLVFRGAQEIAEKLRPDLIWSQPIPRYENGNLHWDLTGYETNQLFPVALAASSGAFAGQNYARGAAQLSLDAATGAINLVPFELEPPTAFPTEIESARQEARRALGLPASTVPVWQQIPIVGAHFSNDPDKQLLKVDAKAANDRLKNGLPVVWDEKQQEIVGRGYFNAVGALQKVALKSTDSEVVGTGATLDEALADLAVAQLAERKNVPSHTASLATRALGVFRQMDNANRNSDAPAYGRRSKQLEHLLEQLAAGRK